MEFALYYTATAIAAYFLADWILDRMEIAYGKRFKYRNYIFFFLILGLAYAILYLIVPEMPGQGPTAPEPAELQVPESPGR